MPTKEEDFPTEGGVRLNRELPLRWRKGEVDTESVRDALMYDNEAALANHAWFEDFERSPYEELPGREGDEAVEARLNLLVAMVGIWMRRQVNMPEPVPVTLDEETLVFECEQAPAVGARVLVEIYLSARFPMPLVFPAEIANVEGLGASGRQRVTSRLLELSRGTRQGIARVAFRYHRRALRARHQREAGRQDNDADGPRSS